MLARTQDTRATPERLPLPALAPLLLTRDVGEFESAENHGA